MFSHNQRGNYNYDACLNLLSIEHRLRNNDITINWLQSLFMEVMYDKLCYYRSLGELTIRSETTAKSGHFL